MSFEIYAVGIFIVGLALGFALCYAMSLSAEKELKERREETVAMCTQLQNELGNLKLYLGRVVNTVQWEIEWCDKILDDPEETNDTANDSASGKIVAYSQCKRMLETILKEG